MGAESSSMGAESSSTEHSELVHGVGSLPNMLDERKEVSVLLPRLWRQSETQAGPAHLKTSWVLSHPP